MKKYQITLHILANNPDEAISKVKTILMDREDGWERIREIKDERVD